MPALRNPNWLKRNWAVLFLLLISCVLSSFCTRAVAQIGLNDLHVGPMNGTAAMASTAEAGAPTESLRPVIRANVDLVLVPVSVTDPMQRLVTGLGQDNFQIFEGKNAQEIRHFSSEDSPVSVGIILDASGSMSDKIDRVREAVNQFCDTANPQDEFFLITFSNEPRLANDFTPVPEDIEKELLFTQPKGRTALLDAIYMGLHKMKEARNGKKALLILSDGGDNHSRYGEKEVKRAARESDVMIYAVGTFDRYVSTEEEMLGPTLLSAIAESTGGRAFALGSAVEVPAVVRRIGVELRTQYVLGYRPQNVPRDGKWHRIKVKLRLPKKISSLLQAHARTGYYAPGE